MSATLLLTLFASATASAQTLTLSPARGSELARVTMRGSALTGTDLAAFEVELQFDGAALRLDRVFESAALLNLDKQVTTDELGSGRVRLQVISRSAGPAIADGELLTLEFQILNPDPQVPVAVDLVNPAGEDSGGGAVSLAGAGSTVVYRALVGDVGGDGATNVQDVQQAINIALGQPFQFTADINRDGSVNVSDVQAIINLALGSQILDLVAPFEGSESQPFTLFGTNLQGSPTTVDLRLGGVPVTVATVTSTTITGVVPAGVTLGDLSLNSGAGAPLSLPFEILPDPDVALSTLSVAPASVPANGTDTAAVTVTLVDSSGFALRGFEISLSSSLAGIAILPALARTNGYGEARFTLSSLQSGGAVLEATALAGSRPFVLTQTASLQFNALFPPSTALSTLSATPNRGLAADGTTAATVTATILDTNGDPMVGSPVEFRLSGAGSLSPVAAVTDVSGQAQSALVSSVAGVSVVTVAVDPGAGEVLVQQPASVVFDAPAVAALSVQPTSLNLAAGERASVTVMADLVAGGSVDVSGAAELTVAAPSLVAGLLADASGARVEALAPGSTVVEFSYGGQTASLPVTVTAATAAELVIAPPSVATAIGLSTTLAASARFSDGRFGPLPAAPAFSSSNPAIASVSTSGVVTANAIGSVTITASVGAAKASVPVLVGGVRLLASSPRQGEVDVAPNRELRLEFTAPVDSSTITAAAIRAEFAGQTLSARRQVSVDRRRVLVFFDAPLPSSARIRVSVDGGVLRDDSGGAVDADGDGVAGGVARIDFDTTARMPFAGTAIEGRVFAADPQSGASTIDLPLAGVLLRVVGAEPPVMATTDAQGNYRLEPAPPDPFVVELDGSSATGGPAGASFGRLLLRLTPKLGATAAAPDAFLAPIDAGVLQALAPTGPTIIALTTALATEFPALASASLTVQESSLFFSDGRSGTAVGLSPVAVDRLPTPLPSGFAFSEVLEVVTAGATIFEPAATLTLPNSGGLAVGAQAALWSYDPGRGAWEIVGTLTVDAGGQTMRGAGVKATGLYAAAPASTLQGGELRDGDRVTPAPSLLPATETLALARNPAASGPALEAAKLELSEERVLRELSRRVLELVDAPAGPVRPATGELVIRETDLVLRGPGLTLRWARTYRHRSRPEAALGHRWDHSFNLRVRSDTASTLRLETGDGRSHVFTELAGFSAAGVARRLTCPGLFANLDELTAGGFLVTFPRGLQWRLRPLDGSPTEGRLDAIEERHGLAITADYDASGRLESLTDTLGRVLAIGYDSADRIASLTDFSGRVVSYAYYDGVQAGGGADDLRSVTGPPVVGTPNGNDFPSGKTRSYSYTAGAADPRLNSRMLSLTDGRGNDPADPASGTPRDSFTYTTIEDPTELAFNRVATHERGGGTIDYAVFAEADSGDGAAQRVIVNDAAGHVRELFYDAQNRLVLDRRFTAAAPMADQPTTRIANRPSAGFRAGDALFHERRLRWNDEGLPTQVTSARGAITELLWQSDRAAGADRSRAGGLLRIRRLPGALAAATVGAELVETFDYSPAGAAGFRLVRRVDATGAETTFRYGSDGDLIQVVDGVATKREDFVRDSVGRVMARLQPDNGAGVRRRDEFSYDSSTGALGAMLVDAGGEDLLTRFEHDSRGNRTASIAPDGARWDFAVNALDEVLRITRPESAPGLPRTTIDRFYDGNGNLVRIDRENRDEAGALRSNPSLTTSFELDRLDRVTARVREVTAAQTVTERREFDGNGNLVLEVSGEAANGNQPGNTIRRAFDGLDRCRLRRRAENTALVSTDELDVDGDGHLVELRRGVEDQPRVTLAVFDGFGRRVEQLDPMENRTLWTYDGAGRVTRRQLFGELDDQPGSAANTLLEDESHSYDAAGRRLTTTRLHFDTDTGLAIGDGLSERSWTWSGHSQPLTETDDSGAVTSFAYDSVGRLGVRTEPKGHTVTLGYDAAGRIVSETRVDLSDSGAAAQTLVTQWTRDGLGRVIARTDPAGAVRERRLDSLDQVTVMLDERRGTGQVGNRTEIAYDGLGRRVRVERFLTDDGTGAGSVTGSIVTTETYDDNDRVVSRSDGLGNVEARTWDALDRLTSVTSADGTVQSFSHDVHDNVVARQDPTGTTWSFDHDGLNRLATRTITPAAGVGGELAASFTRDGASRLRAASNGAASLTRSHDSLGGLIRETLNGEMTVASHDGDGRRVGLIYPGGLSLTRTLDAQGRTATLSEGGTVLLNRSYLGDRVEGASFANGTTLEQDHDAAGRLSAFRHIGGGMPFVSRRRTRDGTGRLIERRDLLAAGLPEIFNTQHDSIGRVVAAQRAPATVVSEAFVYDAAGNRVTVTGGPSAGAWTLDATTPDPADAQVHQYTTTPFDSRTHDANGDLASTVGAAGRSFMRDAFGRLVLLTDSASGDSLAFARDPLGRIVTVMTTTGGQAATRRRFYAGQEWIEEQDASGVTTASFVRSGPGGELIEQRLGVTTLTVHGDGLGSVFALTDAAGQVVELYEYGSFGRQTALSPAGVVLSASAVGRRFGFRGLEELGMTGLLHDGRRSYDPRTGRWNERDRRGAFAIDAHLGNGRTYRGNDPWQTGGAQRAERVRPGSGARDAANAGPWMTKTVKGAGQ